MLHAGRDFGIVSAEAAGVVRGGQAAAIMMRQMLHAIDDGLNEGLVVPYLGPGVLALAGEDCPLPSSPKELTKRLGQAFHRKTVTRGIGEAFSGNVAPTALHNYLATLPALPLIVHDWYDDLPQKALAVRSRWSDWGMVQGASRAEHFGLRYLHAEGTSARASAPVAAERWATLLYEPLGSVAQASAVVGSEGDFIEAAASDLNGEASIPEPVQSLGAGRHFLFLGCRFTEESDRAFARRLLRRSPATHWSVLPEAPTPDEARFMAEQNIVRIDLTLERFVAALAEARREEKTQLLLASW